MSSRSKSEKFIKSRIDRWWQLKIIVSHLSKNEPPDEDGLKKFPGLYRLACADLAEAHMLKLSPDIIEYLNTLVGQAHRHLYSKPPLSFFQIIHFFKQIIPFVFIKNKWFIIISAILFLVPYCCLNIYTINHPEFATRLISSDVLYQLSESYREGFSDVRGAGQNSFAASYYIQHNISIAFYSFATGIFLGIGSIYFLVYNGIILGCISGYIISLGLEKNLWSFVCSHGIFELTGLILAGAAGLLLGYLVINAGKFKRKHNIDIEKNRILTLTGTYVCLIFTAALIEGFISPSPLPLWVKISLCIFSGMFILGYFFIYPCFFLRDSHD